MRGYYGVGIYHPKTEVNMGTLWRTAYLYQAAFIFTIGRRYKKQSSDTTGTQRNVPMFEYTTFEDFNQHRPYDCPVIAIEQHGRELSNFIHPDRGCYLLGAEDYGIPKEILEQCQHHIHIKTPVEISMNVAVAGSIILFDRDNFMRKLR